MKPCQFDCELQDDNHAHSRNMVKSMTTAVVRRAAEHSGGDDSGHADMRTQGATVVAWWTGCCISLWRGEKGRGVERREGSGYVCEVAAVEGMVGKRERIEIKIE